MTRKRRTFTKGHLVKRSEEWDNQALKLFSTPQFSLLFKVTMTTSKKTRPISKMHNKRSRIVIDIKDDSPEATREITASSPDTNSQSSLGGVAVEEEAKRVPLKIDPRTISHLSSEQREAIRQLHP